MVDKEYFETYDRIMGYLAEDQKRLKRLEENQKAMAKTFALMLGSLIGLAIMLIILIFTL